MVALFAMFGLGTMSAAADNQIGTAPVKMTYIDFEQADVAMGQRDTIKVGYNKAPSVGGTIGFGNTGWHCNWTGILKVDVSAIPGTVQKATLKAKISGSTDSKRTTSWGVALTDNEWAADLNYTIAGTWTVSALLNGGNLVWTTTKASTVFEDAAWDITEALSGGQAGATLLVYETQAAGGYMTEAEVEVEYEPFEATTTKFDFEDDVNIFTDDSRISSAIAADDVLGSKVTVFTAAGNCQNGYGFAHYDFTSLLSQPALVAVEFDYYNEKDSRAILTLGDALVRGNNGGCSKNTYGKTGAIFRIGSNKDNAFINDIIFPMVDSESTETVTDPETGEPVIDPETGETLTTTIKTVGLCNKWLHVSVIANNDAKTVTWVVSDQEGNVISEGSDAFWQNDANELTQIDVFAWINNSMSGKIDNLSITNYKSNAVFADYTIKYVDGEGNEIKEARTGNGQVGKFVTLLDSDKAPVYNEDKTKKYIYSSDDSETVAIADGGSAVITVTFRDAEIYYAVLNCKAGTKTVKQYRDLEKYWFFEGDNFYIYPPRGLKNPDDGKYYFTPATSYNGVSVAFPGSIAPATQGGKTYYIDTKVYELVDSVAYYSDFEDLALPVEDEGNGTGLGQLEGTVNSWWSFSGGIFDRFSQGRGIRLDADSYVWTEPIAEAGTYKVTVYGRNDISSGQPDPYVLGLRDTDGAIELYANIVAPEWGSATTGSNVVEGVAIPAGYSLVIYNNDAAKKISLDDISITKTGEYVEPEMVTTGIKVVEVKAQNNGVIYNLAGQVVKSAQKGIFIINGKKVVK